ncbi:MAG: tetratricopeptide repeat protein [Cyclobacteriaceae bacterium]|nr:tetratricopeptide repeat protein [Cyclobacteriaceae bacterium]
MLKTRIILIVVAALLVWLIFLLPKSVVENESQLKEAAPEEPQGTGHAAIPATLSATIKSVRMQFQSNSSNQKNAIFADSLRTLYTQAGQFDSAAWFAGQAATFFNTTESFLKAGNSYYEAYTFAMEPAKQEQLAEKTREWLGKVTAANPKDLEAKTKIAMTYFTSNPPQGVGLLREVLAEDPKNEFALYNMGMLAVQSRQYDRAIERLEELKAVNPNHIQGALMLGVAYLNKGNKNKARQQFELVKTLDKDPAVQATADSYLKDLDK